MRDKSKWLITSNYSDCVSFCQTCFSSNEILSECKTLGHVSVNGHCINEKWRCIKKAIHMKTRKERKIVPQFEKKSEENTMDLYLTVVDP